MGNMYDYFRWRGDLSLLQDGFNELDNLILTYLSKLWNWRKEERKSDLLEDISEGESFGRTTGIEKR